MIRINLLAVERERGKRADPTVSVEVVGGGGDGHASAQGRRQRQQHDGRVQVAGVVRDQDHGRREAVQVFAALDPERTADRRLEREQQELLEGEPDGAGRPAPTPTRERDTLGVLDGRGRLVRLNEGRGRREGREDRGARVGVGSGQREGGRERRAHGGVPHGHGGVPHRTMLR